MYTNVPTLSALPTYLLNCHAYLYLPTLYRTSHDQNKYKFWNKNFATEKSHPHDFVKFCVKILALLYLYCICHCLLLYKQIMLAFTSVCMFTYKYIPRLAGLNIVTPAETLSSTILRYMLIHSITYLARTHHQLRKLFDDTKSRYFLRRACLKSMACLTAMFYSLKTYCNLGMCKVKLAMRTWYYS